MQAQYSTQEQLQELRDLVSGESQNNYKSGYLIDLANSLGLYDAADYISRQFVLGEQSWEKLLSW